MKENEDFKIDDLKTYNTFNSAQTFDDDIDDLDVEEFRRQVYDNVNVTDMIPEHANDLATHQQIATMTGLLGYLKDISEVTTDEEQKVQQKLAGYLTDALENIEADREKEPFNQAVNDLYEELKKKFHTIDKNTAFHQEILNRMVQGFADDTYKYVMERQDGYMIDKWHNREPNEVKYTGFKEMSVKDLKTYARYEKMFDIVVDSDELRNKIYSSRDIPDLPKAPQPSGNEVEDEKANKDYEAKRKDIQKRTQKITYEIGRNEKLYTAMQYSVKGNAESRETKIGAFKTLGHGRLLQPYTEALWTMNVLGMDPGFQKEFPQHEVYGKQLENLKERLKRTDESLFYSQSRDSQQFTNLLDKCTEIATHSEEARRKGEPLAFDREEIGELNVMVDAYFRHCKRNPSGDSRRKERKKIARRIKWICEAFSRGVTPEEHMKDLIAENYYEGVRELSKQEDKVAKLNDARLKRKVIDGYIKESAGFKRMTSKNKNITDLYHLCENKTKTFNKMFSVNSKEDTKQVQSSVKKPTKTKQNEMFM